MNFNILMLNNREISILVWLGIFCIFLVRNKIARAGLVDSLPGLFKALFHPKILIPLVLMIIYVYGLVYLLKHFGFWELALLKDTIIWFLGTAVVMFFNMNKAGKKEHFLRDSILENFKFGAFIGFITNFYVFNFITEMILVPIIFIISVMLAFSGTKKEFKPAKKLLNIIFLTVILVMVVGAVWQLFNRFSDIATLSNLKDFFLAPILSTAYLPFIYFLALLATYESLFARIDGLLKTDKDLASFTKKQILKKSLLSIKKVNECSSKITWNVNEMKKAEISDLIRN